MEYVDILSTALYWYAIGGVALLIGSVFVYGLALLIYWLLARLITLIGHALGYLVSHTDVSLPRHHPSR